MKKVPLATLFYLVDADGDSIARCEELAERTQAQAVDHFIERTRFGDCISALRGGNGAPKERLNALRGELARVGILPHRKEPLA